MGKKYDPGTGMTILDPQLWKILCCIILILIRDVDETLRLVQAFQFTDEHGEVCPAGWRPGTSKCLAVLKIRIHRVHMFLGLLNPDPLVRGMDPDPDH